MFSCLSVGESVCIIPCNGVTKLKAQNLVQIRSILVDIGDKVLATLNVQSQARQKISKFTASKRRKWVRSSQFNITNRIISCLLGFKRLSIISFMVLLFTAQCFHLLPLGHMFALSLLFASHRFIRLENHVAKFMYYYYQYYLLEYFLDCNRLLTFSNFLDTSGSLYPLIHRIQIFCLCLFLVFKHFKCYARSSGKLFCKYLSILLILVKKYTKTVWVIFPKSDTNLHLLY